MKTNYVIYGLVALAVAAGILHFFTKEAEAPVVEGDDTVMCAADVRECPDGSFVSRVAPSCDFAACPGAAE